MNEQITYKVRFGGKNDVEYDTYMKMLQSRIDLIRMDLANHYANFENIDLRVQQSEEGSFIQSILIGLTSTVAGGIILQALSPYITASVNKLKERGDLKKHLKGFDPVEIEYNKSIGKYDVKNSEGLIKPFSPDMIEYMIKDKRINKLYDESHSEASNTCESLETQLIINDEVISTEHYDQESLKMIGKHVNIEDAFPFEEIIVTETVQVKKPDLRGKSKWAVILSNGTAIHAKITDEDFLKRISESKERFTGTTAMVVRLNIIEKAGGGALYEILKVHEVVEERENIISQTLL